MIPLALKYFSEWFHWTVPAVFFYTSTRIILASLFSLLIALFFGPYCIKKLYELKIGQPIRDFTGFKFLLAELHKNKKNTPTMGGVLMIISFLIGALLWIDLKHPFTWFLVLGTLIMGGLGALDDLQKLKSNSFRGLSGKTRLLIQALFGVALLSYFYFPALSGFFESLGFIKPTIIDSLSQSKVTLSEYMERLYIPFVKNPILATSLFGILSLGFLDLIVISGSCNGVNLTDGLDGLAAGCSIFVVGVLAIFGFASNNQELAAYLNILYVEGAGEVSVFLAAVAGSALGFLWYNSHPAQVFMGDTGSLALGGVIGISAVLLKREGLLGLVGGIFVAETVSVILQVISFQLTGKRIFRCAPLHHHYEYEGIHESKVVIRFWIFGLILALAGLASLKFQ